MSDPGFGMIDFWSWHVRFMDLVHQIFATGMSDSGFGMAKQGIWHGCMRSRIRLMAKFSGQWGRWGPLDFWSILNFCMAVLGVGRVPIGLVAPLRFKWLDSQPDSSNMGPVSTDFHEFRDFRKSEPQEARIFRKSGLPESRIFENPSFRELGFCKIQTSGAGIFQIPASGNLKSINIE